MGGNGSFCVGWERERRMWKTITPAEMKRIENEAMGQGLCTGEELMNRAAAAVAEAVRRHGTNGPVIALCGTGNNGGDALAAMGMLATEFEGECWLMAGGLSADAQRELDRLQKEQPRVRVRRLCDDDAYARIGVLVDDQGAEMNLPERVACLVDGLFGTGLSRKVEGVAAALCGLASAAFDRGTPVVAVDIPSGLCGRTGQVLGTAVQATETVTFHRPKPGLFLGQGLDVAGKVTVADIGLGWDNAEGLWVCHGEEIPALLPKRKRTGHKGDHGRVVFFCGSVGMAGAAALAATAALRCGAGLVTVACPQRILDVVQMLCPCATALPLSENAGEAWAQLEPLLAGADALGMGCGLGQSPWAGEMVKQVLSWLSTHDLRAVVDADALNLLSRMEIAALDLSRCVLTPHPGEAARLLGESISGITADPLESAKRLHQRYGAAIVLKGAASVLIIRQGAGLNVLGTQAMGKGGSGDVLTGVLCALLAEAARLSGETDVLAVLQAGCGLHGLAGCAAEATFGPRGVLATDLCCHLGCMA